MLSCLTDGDRFSRSSVFRSEAHLPSSWVETKQPRTSYPSCSVASSCAPAHASSSFWGVTVQLLCLLELLCLSAFRRKAHHKYTYTDDVRLLYWHRRKHRYLFGRIHIIGMFDRQCKSARICGNQLPTPRTTKVCCSRGLYRLPSCPERVWFEVPDVCLIFQGLDDHLRRSQKLCIKQF